LLLILESAADKPTQRVGGPANDTPGAPHSGAPEAPSSIQGALVNVSTSVTRLQRPGYAVYVASSGIA